MSAALSFGRKYGMMTKGNNKSHYRVKPRKMLGPYSGVLPSFTLGWTFFLPLANFISSYKGGEMREKRTPHRCDAITASLQGRAAPWTLRAFTEFFFFTECQGIRVLAVFSLPCQGQPIRTVSVLWALYVDNHFWLNSIIVEFGSPLIKIVKKLIEHSFWFPFKE